MKASQDSTSSTGSCELAVLRGKHSMSNRKEGRKWRENTNQKAPDGFSRLKVFEKAATKKDDHNHPNSLQRINYRKEYFYKNMPFEMKIHDHKQKHELTYVN